MSLLQMSFSGAVMILAIIVVRTLAINKLPKKVFALLWEVVLLRLLIPFSIPSMFSAYSFVRRNTPIREAMDEIPAATVIAPVAGEQLNLAGNVGDALPVSNAPQNVSVWTILWIAGFILCAVFFVVLYLRYYFEFRTSLPVRNAFTTKWLREHQLRRTIQIRQSDRISAPLTYGIVRPVILMPKKTDWENDRQLQYILLHEYVHICRFDMAVKLVATLALCIHWFNPLVWAMYILFNRDIELSCDESVVRQFGEKSKSAYARTLITMEEKKSGLTPLYNSFSRNAIEERITAIMKTKKVTIGILVISVLVIISIVVLFATSAEDDGLGDVAVKEDSSETEMNETEAEGIVKEDIEVTGTALEMAKEVVVRKYAERKDDGYCNWKIESLTEEYSYDFGGDRESGGMRVTVYQLNYMFLAENPEKVTLSGGMTMDEEGWVVPEYAGSTYLCLVADGGALSYQVLVEHDCFPGEEVFTEDLKQMLHQGNDDEYLEIIKENEKQITEQIADIIGEAESVRYVLENCELEIRGVGGNRADCTFWADWKSIREPEDDPLIQGLYQAAEALSDKAEKEHAKEIADGWLLEIQSWPKSERINTEIAVLFDDADSWELYFKYVMNSGEELIPLHEYAAQYMTEDGEERRQQGIDIIDEAMSSFRKQNSADNGT